MESDTSTVNMSFVVDEDNMASNSATKVPTQQSVKAYVDANAGGSGISNVSEDTTPQLGGTLDTNGNLIQFGDSGSSTDDRLQFGASQDLQIYHDGSHNYIETIVSDANLRIKQAGAGGVELYANAPKILFNDINGGTQVDFSIADDNGSFTITDETNSDTVLNYTQNAALELYYNNSKKFETTGAGVTITGICSATSFSGDGSNLSNVDADTLGGQSYFNWLRSNVEDFKTGGPLVFSDNIACAIGSNKDLEIYHNGTHNFIDNNRNSLYIRNNVDSDFGGDIYIQAKSNENSIVCQDDGEVQLYYDGSEKLNTSSTGVTVTGNITVSGTVDGRDVATDGTKLDAIEASADVTDATNVDAAGAVMESDTSTVNMSFVVDEDDMTSDSATKVPTQQSVKAYVDANAGGGGGGSGEFNTGITSSVQITPLSYETSVFTFPSTSGKQYTIESINVANVDTSVGVGTTVNIIASIEDATAGEQTYIAYNVPIVNGGVIELLKNPIVAGPSDVIKMWVTNEGYVGTNNAAEVYMNYSEYTSTDYVKAFASTVSIATTDVTGILTSTSNPTVIESIHLANRTDTGDYPVSVRITQGTSTSHLVKDLIIPRYSTVDILDRQKRIETNSVIEVKVEQTSTIDVIIAGKKITS